MNNELDKPWVPITADEHQVNDLVKDTYSFSLTEMRSTEREVGLFLHPFKTNDEEAFYQVLISLGVIQKRPNLIEQLVSDRSIGEKMSIKERKALIAATLNTPERAAEYFRNRLRPRAVFSQIVSTMTPEEIHQRAAGGVDLILEVLTGLTRFLDDVKASHSYTEPNYGDEISIIDGRNRPVEETVDEILKALHKDKRF